jgi:hypothetical protein
MPSTVGVLSSIRYVIGTDRIYRFTVYTNPDVRDTCLDVTGQALSFMVKRRIDDLDYLALITKATPTITITGTFDASPALNTQRILVPVADTDTDNLVEGTAVFELKRMDPGLEDRYSYGPFELERGIHRT